MSRDCERAEGSHRDRAQDPPSGEEKGVIRLAERIVVDPAIRSGRPVIEGTRVPVEIVIGHVAAGMTVEAVADEFDLSREDVLAALSYAAQAVASEEIRAV